MNRQQQPTDRKAEEKKRLSVAAGGGGGGGDNKAIGQPQVAEVKVDPRYISAVMVAFDAAAEADPIPRERLNHLIASLEIKEHYEVSLANFANSRLRRSLDCKRILLAAARLGGLVKLFQLFFARGAKELLKRDHGAAGPQMLLAEIIFATAQHPETTHSIYQILKNSYGKEVMAPTGTQETVLNKVLVLIMDHIEAEIEGRLALQGNNAQLYAMLMEYLFKMGGSNPNLEILITKPHHHQVRVKVTILAQCALLGLKPLVDTILDINTKSVTKRMPINQWSVLSMATAKIDTLGPDTLKRIIKSLPNLLNALVAGGSDLIEDMYTEFTYIVTHLGDTNRISPPMADFIRWMLDYNLLMTRKNLLACDIALDSPATKQNGLYKNLIQLLRLHLLKTEFLHIIKIQIKHLLRKLTITPELQTLIEESGLKNSDIKDADDFKRESKNESLGAQEKQLRQLLSLVKQVIKYTRYHPENFSNNGYDEKKHAAPVEAEAESHNHPSPPLSSPASIDEALRLRKIWSPEVLLSFMKKYQLIISQADGWVIFKKNFIELEKDFYTDFPSLDDRSSPMEDKSLTGERKISTVVGITDIDGFSTMLDFVIDANIVKLSLSTLQQQLISLERDCEVQKIPLSAAIEGFPRPAELAHKFIILLNKAAEYGMLDLIELLFKAGAGKILLTQWNNITEMSGSPLIKIVTQLATLPEPSFSRYIGVLSKSLKEQLQALLDKCLVASVSDQYERKQLVEPDQTRICNLLRAGANSQVRVTRYEEFGLVAIDGGRNSLVDIFIQKKLWQVVNVLCEIGAINENTTLQHSLLIPPIALLPLVTVRLLIEKSPNTIKQALKALNVLKTHFLLAADKQLPIVDVKESTLTAQSMALMYYLLIHVYISAPRPISESVLNTIKILLLGTDNDLDLIKRIRASLIPWSSSSDLGMPHVREVLPLINLSILRAELLGILNEAIKFMQPTLSSPSAAPASAASSAMPKSVALTGLVTEIKSYRFHTQPAGDGSSFADYKEEKEGKDAKNGKTKDGSSPFDAKAVGLSLFTLSTSNQPPVAGSAQSVPDGSSPAAIPAVWDEKGFAICFIKARHLLQEHTSPSLSFLNSLWSESYVTRLSELEKQFQVYFPKNSYIAEAEAGFAECQKGLSPFPSK